MELRTKILEKFEIYVLGKHREYCKEHCLALSSTSLIGFLIDFEIITQKSIWHYTILNEFETLYLKEHFKKTETVERLAKRFNISERTIWNILRMATTKKL